MVPTYPTIRTTSMQCSRFLKELKDLPRSASSRLVSTPSNEELLWWSWRSITMDLVPVLIILMIRRKLSRSQRTSPRCCFACSLGKNPRINSVFESGIGVVPGETDPSSLTDATHGDYPQFCQVMWWGVTHPVLRAPVRHSATRAARRVLANRVGVLSTCACRGAGDHYVEVSLSL